MALLEDCARLQIQAHFASGQVLRNSIHIVKDGAGVPDTAELLSLATAFGDLVKTTYKALLNTTDTLDGILATQMREAADHTTPLGQSLYSLALAGTRSGSRQTATEMTLCAKLKSTLTGRRYRGHNFLPGPVVVATELDGENVPTGVTAYTNSKAYLDVLKTGFDGAGSPWSGALSGWTVAIYSAAADLAGDTPIFAAVSSYELPNRLHWLRSRGRGTT
jgi:hypothetical protein